MLKTPGDRGGGKDGVADSPAIFSQGRAFRQPRRRSAAEQAAAQGDDQG